MRSSEQRGSISSSSLSSREERARSLTGDEKRLREDVETKPSGVERERRGDLAPLGLLSRSCL